MSTQTHTPGPWEVQRFMQGAMDHLVIVGNNGWVCSIGEVHHELSPKRIWPEEQANARLIAVCPTMHTFVSKIASMGGPLGSEAQSILDSLK